MVGKAPGVGVEEHRRRSLDGWQTREPGPVVGEGASTVAAVVGWVLDLMREREEKKKS